MFFRYPGGKSRLRRKIKEQFPELIEFTEKHSRIISPFCGSAHFELSFKDKDLWLNDKNIGVYCLWDAVSSNPVDLNYKIGKYKPSVDSFQDFKKELLDLVVLPSTEEDVVDIAFKKIVLHQCSYSGLAEMGGPLGGKNQNSTYTIDCRWNPEVLSKKILRLHTQLKHAKITKVDYSKVISQVEKNFLFVDPPYFEKSQDLYKDHFQKQDHENLAKSLKNSSSPFILSYDPNDWVYNTYGGWTNIYELKTNYKIGKNSKNTVELIIQRDSQD